MQEIISEGCFNMTPQAIVILVLILFMIFIIYLARKKSQEGFDYTKKEMKQRKLLGIK